LARPDLKPYVPLLAMLLLIELSWLLMALMPDKAMLRLMVFP
jgi:hypothetical protein